MSNVLMNPLVGMLPYARTQAMVYKHGEKFPPGLRGYTPTWEPVGFNLAQRETQQYKFGLKPKFHLLGFIGNSPQAAGFRVQLYDVNKKRKLHDRGANFSLVLGTGGNPFFLREPYAFDEPNSQVLIIVQNLANVANAVQVVLYGMSLRWNEPDPGT